MVSPTPRAELYDTVTPHQPRRGHREVTERSQGRKREQQQLCGRRRRSILNCEE